jgi:hypothetical protein
MYSSVLGIGSSGVGSGGLRETRKREPSKPALLHEFEVDDHMYMCA